MPAPWLVTNPPTQIRQNVAAAVNAAKRCSQWLSKDRVMRSVNPAPENSTGQKGKPLRTPWLQRRCCKPV